MPLGFSHLQGGSGSGCIADQSIGLREVTVRRKAVQRTASEGLAVPLPLLLAPSLSVWRLSSVGLITGEPF